MAVTIGSGITIGGRIGIGLAPTITVGTQPSSVTSYQGETATFTTSATATFGAIVSYQWAKLEAQGGSWTNITNATSSSYTTGGLNVATDNGDQYRCVISATRGAASVNTNTATLYVQQAVITIDQQPNNQSVADGVSFEFFVYVSVTLSATVSYQWQVVYNGQSTWSNLVGETTYRYMGTAQTNDSGNQYRVIVSANKGATSVTSNTATLTVVQNNTMIVASSFNGVGTITGANKGTYGSPLGTLTSDYLSAVYTYNTGNLINTFVRLIPGSYSGFSVGNEGQIDNDPASYPRLFTIGGTTYTMYYMANDFYYTFNGNLGLTDGTTVPVSYSGQPAITPNTILSASYLSYGETFYGASTGLNNPGYGTGDGAVYGSIITEYFYKVETRYTGSEWISLIWMKNGSWSGFSVVNGVVSGDTTGSTRVFTIGGTNYTFTAQTGDPSQPYYLYNGQISELINTGTFVPTIYDPAENGGGSSNTTVGTITVGSFAGTYGWRPGLTGSGNFSPNMVYWLYYNGMSTEIMFITGTYGSVVVDSTTVDGKPDVTVTVGNITETGTLASSGGGPGPVANFTGDIFNLQSQQYQTLPVEVLASGGGGGSVTYVGGVDYQNNSQMGQPGIYFSNPPSGNSVFVYSSAWTTPAGATALLALTSGSTFTVSTTPDGGGAPVTAIITLTGTYNTNWGDPSATITTSVPISYQYPNNVPASVTLSGGGGGGEVASGSLTVGDYSPNEFGYDPYSPIGPIGSLTISPIAVENLVYLSQPNFTIIIFPSGTYGSVVVTSTTINGSSSVSVTIGGVTQTGTLSSFGPSTGLQLTGDVFSLATKVGQTLPISVSTDGGGGGTAETFTQAGNWSSASWTYNGMGTGRLSMNLESNPNSSFLAAINSVTGSSGTTVTMTDGQYGTSTAVAITGISSMSSMQPWGPFSTASFNLATHGGNDWYNINTITLATAGGGGGTSIANISNLFHDGYASPQPITTFSFSTQQQRDAAYTLLNGPGTWNCVGNYYSPLYGGSPLHGSFSMSLSGPSTTDDLGPPSFMYRVLSPSNISNAVSDGPATGGPFSASK